MYTKKTGIIHLRRIDFIRLRNFFSVLSILFTSTLIIWLETGL